MSAIKNGQVSLYCLLKKIEKSVELVSSLQHLIKNVLEMCILAYNTLVFDQISF